MMGLLRFRGTGITNRYSGNMELVSRTRYRSWPLLYRIAQLVTVLLFSAFLLQLGYKAVFRTTVFGDNLRPVPWHMHHNPLGLHAFTWKRALKIRECSSRTNDKREFSVAPEVRTNATTTENSSLACPSFFQWIRSDLAPWMETKIDSSHLESARQHAAFRLTIVNGKLFVDMYYSCVQTRALFTVWGVLLLLEKYRGRVPDVDLMFDCMDRPHLNKTELQSDLSSRPVLFRYCSTKYHYDIPFPDWSFWGWYETNIEPWNQQREIIAQASSAMKWHEKTAKAFWRGNPNVGSPLRMELLKCNPETGFATRTEIQNQNWVIDNASGGSSLSKLENHCKHRYKIYAEGFAWSVSFKYILSCGSPTLVLSPRYYDFFSRGLKPWVHYIPVRPKEICAKKLCSSVDSAVEWGEADPVKASAIGENVLEFLRRELNMGNVYDYMFHLIREYSQLQTFQPSVPKTASEVTQESLLCLAEPPLRSLLLKSKAEVDRDSLPCQMPGGERSGSYSVDPDWEAKEQEDKDWSENRCTRRKA